MEKRYVIKCTQKFYINLKVPYRLLFWVKWVEFERNIDNFFYFIRPVVDLKYYTDFCNATKYKTKEDAEKDIQELMKYLKDKKTIFISGRWIDVPLKERSIQIVEVYI